MMNWNGKFMSLNMLRNTRSLVRNVSIDIAQYVRHPIHLFNTQCMRNLIHEMHNKIDR